MCILYLSFIKKILFFIPGCFDRQSTHVIVQISDGVERAIAELIVMANELETATPAEIVDLQDRIDRDRADLVVST